MLQVCREIRNFTLSLDNIWKSLPSTMTAINTECMNMKSFAKLTAHIVEKYPKHWTLYVREADNLLRLSLSLVQINFFLEDLASMIEHLMTLLSVVLGICLSCREKPEYFVWSEKLKDLKEKLDCHRQRCLYYFCTGRELQYSVQTARNWIFQTFCQFPCTYTN
jgi:hypothetical protein